LIDYLAIGVTHLLLVLAVIRLLARGDLDREPEGPAPADTTPSRPDAPPARNGVARLPRLGKGGRRA
jgi:hypothetical protein